MNSEEAWTIIVNLIKSLIVLATSNGGRAGAMKSLQMPSDLHYDYSQINEAFETIGKTLKK